MDTFCPRCGTQRAGAFRYCRKCGFDFESGELDPQSPQPPAPLAPIPPSPAPDPAPVAEIQAKRPWYRGRAGVGLGAVLVLVALAAVGRPGQLGSAPSADTAAPRTPAPSVAGVPVTAAPTAAPTDPPAPTAAPTSSPHLSREQENAIGLAEDYLDYTAFSRSGLIEQLVFEGFSTKVATFAVDYLNVNWKEQAWQMAEDYLNYSHFSRSSLIEQLEFEGFTHAQAVYGVDKAGL